MHIDKCHGTSVQMNSIMHIEKHIERVMHIDKCHGTSVQMNSSRFVSICVVASSL